MSCWPAQIDTKTPKRGPIVSVELYILSTWRMPLSLQYEAAFDNKPQMSGFNSRFSLSFSSLVSNPRVPALIAYMLKTQAWLKPNLQVAKMSTSILATQVLNMFYICLRMMK